MRVGNELGFVFVFVEVLTTEVGQSSDRRLGVLYREIVSFLRAYALSGCLVELDIKFCGLLFSLSPFGPGELSLFPFGVTSLPFSLPYTPQTSYPFLVGLIGICKRSINSQCVKY